MDYYHLELHGDNRSPAAATIFNRSDVLSPTCLSSRLYHLIPVEIRGNICFHERESSVDVYVTCIFVESPSQLSLNSTADSTVE